MLGKKLGIDIGTTAVRVAVRGDGLVFSEPSLVHSRRNGMAGAVVGAAALEQQGERPLVMLRRPLVAGAIADEEALGALLNGVVTRAVGRQRIFKPDIVCSVMSALPGGHRRALLELAMRVGARTVYLLDAPLAVAMGSVEFPASAEGHLVIDCGGGKTDIAALALEGTVASRCLPVGAVQLGEAVTQHLHDRHGISVSPPVAADIVASLACIAAPEERRLTVSGDRGGEPSSLVVTSAEIAPYAEVHARSIARAVHDVLDEVPEPLLAHIRTEGIILAGGGARLEGLDRFLSSSTGMRVNLQKDPQLCAVRGTAAAAENLDALRRGFLYIR